MLVKAMKKESKKPMVDYLELDNNTYIENDVIKTRINESKDNDECSWDELWEVVLKIMGKIRRYDELHNQSYRVQEEFIEQCRRELEARVEELR